MNIYTDGDLNKLARFLVRAKRASYAGDGKEVSPQRPGFREHEYVEGDWNYRDSYTGYYMAPGQEVVRFQGNPVWHMAYSGGMNPKLFEAREFTERTFEFLKTALSKVPVSLPFRGPASLTLLGGGEEAFEYMCSNHLDIRNFTGKETIRYRGRAINDFAKNRSNFWNASEPVFEQDYIGGLIAPKAFS